MRRLLALAAAARLLALPHPVSAADPYVLRGMMEFTGSAESPGAGIANVALIAPGDKIAFRITAPRGGNLSKVHLNIKQATVFGIAVDVRASGGDPEDGGLLASGAISGIDASRWWAASVPVSLTAGVNYWIVIRGVSGGSINDYPLSMPGKTLASDFVRGIPDPLYDTRVFDSDGVPLGWQASDHNMIYALEYSDGSLYGNGYANVPALSEGNTSIHSSGGGASSTHRWVQQSYLNRSGSSIRVAKLEFNLTKGGSPTTDLFYEIREDTATANVLVSSGSFARAADIPASPSFAWVGVALRDVVLAAGKPYQIVLKPDPAPGTDGSNFYFARVTGVGGSAAGDTIADREWVTYLSSDSRGQRSANGGATWTDLAGVADLSMRFVQDATPPVIAIISPGVARSSDLSATAGLASDPSPGFVKEVQLRIRRLTGLVRYFDPDALAFSLDPSLADAAFFRATYDAASLPPDWAEWTVSTGAAQLVSGNEYSYEARALDYGGNYSTAYSTRSVIYDPDAPQTGVTLPADGAFRSSVASIQGTAADFPGANPGTVTGVNLRLRRNTDQKYWDGSNWGTPEVPLPADVVAEGGWSRVTALPSAGDLTSGASYYITSSGVDDASPANVEALYNVRGSTFTFDNTAPTAVTLAKAFLSVDNKVYGTAADPVPLGAGGELLGASGIAEVQLSLRNTSLAGPNNCLATGLGTWTAFCPNYFGADDGVTGTTSWSYQILAPLATGHRVEVTARARDNAGNLGSSFFPVTLTYDKPEAACSASVDAGPPLLQLALDAIPAVIDANVCVHIANATYGESLSVRNRTYASNVFRVTFDGPGGFATMEPPSEPAFTLALDSVTISGIKVAPGNTIPYGVLASSSYARIEGVLVEAQPSGSFSTAGIWISSHSQIFGSTSAVLAAGAAGLWITGSSNTVSYSSFTHNHASDSAGAALRIQGAGNNAISFSTITSGHNAFGGSGRALDIDRSTENVVSDSYLSCPGCNAVHLRNDAAWNTVRRSTVSVPTDVPQSGAVTLQQASSNTLTELFVLAKRGIVLSNDSRRNVLSASTSTVIGGSSYEAMGFATGSGNLVTGCYLGGGVGPPLQFTGGDDNEVTSSTIAATTAAHAARLRFNSDRNRIESSRFYRGIEIDDSSGNEIRGSTITTSFNPAITIANRARSNRVVDSYLQSGSNNTAQGAFDISASSWNTFERSAAVSTNWANALRFGERAAFNLVVGSTLTAAGGGRGGWFESYATSNSIVGSIFRASANNGLQFDSSAATNTVTGSTVTTIGAASAGIFVAGSSTTIQASYVQAVTGGAALQLFHASATFVSSSTLYGSRGLWVFGSTSTLVEVSSITALSLAAVESLEGGSGFVLRRSTVTATASVSGMAFMSNGGSESAGFLVVENNLIQGAATGVGVATQPAGTQVWITSNTILPGFSPSFDAEGIAFLGLLTGATVYNNQIYWRAGGNYFAGRTAAAIRARSVRGLRIERNRISQPGLLEGQAYFHAFEFHDADGTSIKFNDVNLQDGPSSLFGFRQLSLLAVSTGVVSRNNVFRSSTSFTGDSLAIELEAGSEVDSDYNAYHAPGSGMKARVGGTDFWLLDAWRRASGKDLHSVQGNTRWLDMTPGTEDFHPRSEGGRWTEAGPVNDQITAVSVDGGDPAEPIGGEVAPHGGVVNLGSYGGTVEASHSYPEAGLGNFSGCSRVWNVAKADVFVHRPDTYTLMGAVMEMLPLHVSTNVCVVVRESSIFDNERVKLEGFVSGGSRIRILGDPALNPAPRVQLVSTAASIFEVRSASVSIETLRIENSGMSTSYGIFAASDSIRISSVSLGTDWEKAAVSLSSFSIVEYSTITVNNSVGLQLVGWGSEVRGSTFTSVSRTAVRFSGSTNTVSGSYLQAGTDLTADFATTSASNTVALSSVVGTGAMQHALVLRGSSDTVSGSWILCPNCTVSAINLAPTASYSQIRASTVTAGGAADAIEFNGADRNRISDVYAQAGRRGFHLRASGGTDQATFNEIERSTSMSSGGGGVAGVYLNAASSNTFRQFLSSSSATPAFQLESGSNDNRILLSTGISNWTSGALGVVMNSTGTVIEDSYFYGATGIDLQTSLNTVLRSTAVGAAAFGGGAGAVIGGGQNVLSGCWLHGLGTNVGLKFPSSSGNHRVELSTIVSEGSHGANFDRASGNLLASSYLESRLGAPALYLFGATSNAVYGSTLAKTSGGNAVIRFEGSSSNTLSGLLVHNRFDGPGLELLSRSDFNRVLVSTVIGAHQAVDTGAAILVSASSGTHLSGLYVQSSTPVWVSGSTNTVIAGSRLVSTSTAEGSYPYIVRASEGGGGLFVSSSALSGSGRTLGVYTEGVGGPIVVATNTITNAEYGIELTFGNPRGVLVSSNTIVPRAASSGIAIYAHGMTFGASIQDNSVLWPVSTTGGGEKFGIGIYNGSTGSIVKRNRISHPGGGTTGFTGIHVSNSANVQVLFNDVNASAAGASRVLGVRASGASTGLQLNHNVFRLDGAPSVAGSSATVLVEAGSEDGFAAKYNDYFSANALNSASFGGAPCQLPSWSGCTVAEPGAIAADPLWASLTVGAEDFHPKSRGGRFTQSGVALDAVTSPTIDAGEPGNLDLANEPQPNGARVNLGSYGGTAEASFPPPPEGCDVEYAVPAPYGQIQLAINAVPEPVSNRACVVIHAAGTYPEALVVNKAMAETGRLKIIAHPNLAAGAVQLSGPAESVPVVDARSSSVTLGGLYIGSAAGASWGVHSDASYLVLSTVTVDNGLGVRLSSYSLVERSAVIGGAGSRGIRLTGIGYEVRDSTVAVDSSEPALAVFASSGAVRDSFVQNVGLARGLEVDGAGGAFVLERSTVLATSNDVAVLLSGSTNTIRASYLQGSSGLAINSASRENLVEGSTIASITVGTYALTVNGTSNTVTGSFVANYASSGRSAAIGSSGHSNRLVRSTFTATSDSGEPAVALAEVSSNTLDGVYIGQLGPGYALQIEAGASNNVVQGSTITALGEHAAVLYGASTTTIRGSWLRVAGPEHAVYAQDTPWVLFDSNLIENANGKAVKLVSAHDWTITRSTLTGRQGVLTVEHSSRTLVSSSTILGTEGSVVRLDESWYTTLRNSTMTTTATGSNEGALRLDSSSGTSVYGSYLQGQSGLWSDASTATVVSGSRLVGNANGPALRLQNGSLSLDVRDNDLWAGSAAMAVEVVSQDGLEDNAGVITIASNSVYAGWTGIRVATMAAGSQVWITTNTVFASAGGSEALGIVLEGVRTGATVQANSVLFWTPGSVENFACGICAQSSANLVIRGNRVSNPNRLSASQEEIGIGLDDADGVLVAFNDVHLAHSLPQNRVFPIGLANGSTGVSLRNNIVLSSFTVSGASATILVDSASQSGFRSDYNAFFSSNGVLTVDWGGGHIGLPGSSWRAMGNDRNSIVAHPRWASLVPGEEDFHPLSQAGRFLSGAFVNDSLTSTAIDRADPTENAGAESLPPPNAFPRANLGSYGQTAEASRTPAPPANLSLPAVYSGSATLAWSIDNVDGYQAEASLASDFLTVLASASPTGFDTQLSPQGLSPNTTYYFRAAARWTEFLSYSEVQFATSTLAQPPMGGVPNVFTGVTPTTATLIWSANGNPVDVTTYSIVRTTMSFFPSSAADSTSISTSSPLSHEWGGLQSNATYYFFGSARNWHGVYTPYVLLGSTATLPAEPVSAVSTFSALSADRIVVAWGANGNATGTRYEARLSPNEADPLAAGSVAVSTEPESAPSAEFLALQANTTYHLFVRAIGREGRLAPASGYAALGSTPTLANPPLAMGGGAWLMVGESSATVQWNSNANPGGTRYVVTFSTDPAIPNTAEGNVVVSTEPSGSPQVTATGLFANATYYVSAAAQNRVGALTAFNLIGATQTLLATPTAAAAPFFPVFATSATVQWQANGNAPGSRYEVRASTSDIDPAASASVFVSTEPQGAPAAALNGLLDNTSYFLFVRGVGRDGARPHAYQLLGSTITASPTPSVYVDEVTSTSIVASAYAPAPAFMNLDKGESATNVALDGAFSPLRWHGESWGPATGLPTASLDHIVAAVDGRLYALGGFIGARSWAPGEETWLARTPYAADASDDQGAGAAIGRRVYFAGGINGTTVLRVYDTVTDTWASVAPMPTARKVLAAAAVAGRFYALGGNNSAGTDLAANEEYLPAGDLWAPKADLPAARSHLAAVALDGKVYALGGSPGGALNERYDPAGNSWLSRASMPTARSYFVAAAVGGKLYAIGGNGGATANEEYDPAADTWTARSPMPTGRWRTAGAALGGRIYVVAGELIPSFTGTSVNEVYDPGVAQSYAGLTPNTPYAFKAKARNQVGQESAESVEVTTYTLAAVPAPSTAAIYEMGSSSVGVQWLAAGNPANTAYFVEASTAAGFGGTLFGAGWAPGLSAWVSGLAANTTYFLRVKARNQYGRETDYLQLGSSSTLTAPPALASPAFTLPANATSLLPRWGLATNPVNVTTFTVTLTTSAAFPNSDLGNRSSGALFDGAWGAVASAAVGGLERNTTYYAFAAGVNHVGVVGPYTMVGATSTLVEAPAAAGDPFFMVGETSMTVRWDPNGNPLAVTTFTVVLSSSAGPNTNAGNVALSTVALAAPAFATFETLAANTSYHLFIGAVNHTGIASSFLSFGSTVTLLRPPEPAAVPFLAADTMTLTATWAGPNGPDTLYDAVVSTESPLVLTHAGNLLVSTRPSGGVQAPFSSLVPNTQYHLFVRAIGRTGAATAYVAAGSTYTRIETPVGIAFDAVTETTIDLSVTPPVGGFTALLTPASGVQVVKDGAPGAFSTVMTRSFAELLPNRQYVFTAKARNQEGTETPETAVFSTHTHAAVPVPGAPEAHVSSITLAWSLNGNLGSTEFEVQASTVAGFDSGDTLSSGWGAVVSTAVGGLTADSLYNLRVRARNGSGIATAWVPAGATTTFLAAPGPAASTFTAVHESSVSVAWSANGNPLGSTAYKVALSTDVAYPNQHAGTIELSTRPPTGLAATLSGLAVNASYYLYIAATGVSGSTGPHTGYGSFWTRAAAPSAAGTPFPDVQTTSVTVSWALGTDPAATEFEASASTEPVFASTVASSAWASGTAATLSGLSGDTTHYFRVRARNGAGVASAYLAVGSTMTLAGPPIGRGFAHVGAFSAAAAWDAENAGGGVAAWQTLASLPSALQGHAAVGLGGRVYVSGGSAGGAALATVRYAQVQANGSLGAWSAGTSLPAARDSHAMAAWGGRLYVAGGTDGAVRSTVWSAALRSDGSVGEWSAHSSLPAPRMKLALVAHAGWLYALGGDNGVFPQATVWSAPIRSDGSLGAWTATTALSPARGGHAAAVANGRVYVSGGVSGAIEDSVVHAQLGAGSVGAWSAGTRLPGPRTRHAFLATPGRLYSAGGHDGADASASVWVATVAADGSTGQWAAQPGLPAGRYLHAAAHAGTRIYVLGGADSAAPVDTVWASSLTGTSYELWRASDSNFTLGLAAAPPTAARAFEFGDLTPNTRYHFHVAARSHLGLLSPYEPLGSTVTLAAPPGAPLTPFTLVEISSVGIQWSAGANPTGTEFSAQASTASDFSGTLASTAWGASVSAVFQGLLVNTSYYFRSQARNLDGVPGSPLFLGAVFTLSSAPVASTITAAHPNGFSLSWSTGNLPASTRYEVQASTAADFGLLAASSVTYSSHTTFAALPSAATFYARVRSINGNGVPSAFDVTLSTRTGLDAFAPGVSTGTQAQPGGVANAVFVSWIAPPDDGAVGDLPPGSEFRVQWSSKPAETIWWSTAAAQIVLSTGPVLAGTRVATLVSGLPSESTVTFKVWTRDEAGNYSVESGTFSSYSSPFAFSRVDGALGDLGVGPSLAVDRFGDLHLAYRGAAGELRYAKRTGGVWGAPEAPDPGAFAAELSLAVDADGEPQLAYRDLGVARLKHAKRSGSWSATVIETGNFRLGGLALDMEGRAQVSYQAVAAADLKFASWTGTGWAVSTPVSGGNDFGRVSALALKADQAPVLLYSDDTLSEFWAASPNAGGWTQSAADITPIVVGSSPSAVLNGAGEFFAAYHDSVAGRLRISSGTVGSVAFVNQPSVGQIGAVGGLALDGAGRSFVTFYDKAANDLRYFRVTAVGVTSGTIDSGGDVGSMSSLAIDAAGSVHVAYYDATNGDLKVAEWPAAVTPAAGGNSRGRAMAPSGIAGTVLSQTQIRWSWTDNAMGELRYDLYGSTSVAGPFERVAQGLVAVAGAGSGTSYLEGGLAAHTTYYRYAVAVTSGGAVASRLASAYPFNTVDVTSPTMTVNQTGDALWRRANTGLYNIDFADIGGSRLSKFQVKASTWAGDSGTGLVPFTDVVTAIAADSYTADWSFPQAFFDGLRDGVTNYISVRALDGNGNATTYLDAYYVLKDTSPPTLSDFQSGDDALRTLGGTLYNVDVQDGASRLAAFQYSVSTKPALADASSIGWTTIANVSGLSSSVTDFPVDFASLVSDVTAYVSVRAWDVAGSTSVLVDAFYVKKDVLGPSVRITSPQPLQLSALTTVAGTAADWAGVAGVQWAVQRVSDSRYWDGNAFPDAAERFFPATGTVSWQFSPGIPWADAATYRLISRSSDSLGNFSAVYSTVAFTFDGAAPTAGVTAPATGSSLNALPTITGTAADTGAGVASVEVRLRRLSDGRWWSWAGAWTTVAVSSVAAGANAWSLTPDAPLLSNLATNTSYFIAARGLDSSTPGNSGDFFAQGSTFTFVDNTAPSAITDLAGSSDTTNGRIFLTWTAPGDDAGSGTLLFGEYRIAYATFTSFNFSTMSAQVIIATASVPSGTRRGHAVTNLLAGSTYYLRVFAADDAGNWSGLSNQASMMAGPPYANQIGGRVVKVSSEGITAVQIDCYDSNNGLISSTFTVADGLGSFILGNVPAGTHRVQASWTADGITSSVWQDNIAQGASGIEFVLNLSYSLAALTGQLQSLAAPQGRHGAAASAFMIRAQEGAYEESRVELFVGGRRAVEVPVTPTGRWTISNLLPGKYGVRAFNGISHTEVVEVEVGEGELKEVGFVYSPLPEASVFAFPNPASARTTFRFETPLLPLEAQVQVFDVNGLLVRELAGSEMRSTAPGVYHAEWDLRNASGEPVASGIYLFMVKVRGGSENQTAKVIKKLAIVR